MNTKAALFAIILIAVAFYAVLNIDALPMLLNTINNVGNILEPVRPIAEMILG